MMPTTTPQKVKTSISGMNNKLNIKGRGSLNHKRIYHLHFLQIFEGNFEEELKLCLVGRKTTFPFSPVWIRENDFWGLKKVLCVIKGWKRFSSIKEGTPHVPLFSLHLPSFIS